MAFLQVEFYSNALNVVSAVNVILPEAYRKDGMLSPEDPPKVLYLLHGYSNNHTNWMRKSSIERYAEPYHLAVIMPAVNHSFYCNEVYGERYWDYVSEELPGIMHKFFRLSDRPEDTFVAGLSMGGYGALRLALTYPERFGAAGSFSGAVNLAALAASPEQAQTSRRIFGEDLSVYGSEADTLYLMKKNADAPKKPKLYISCGTADFLYGMHDPFIKLLEENHWDVTRRDEPGASHTWEFWDQEIKYFLAFIDKKD